jgi:hypothetical protein
MRPANRSYNRRPKLCAMQMEGIVSKSVAAPNRSGRNEAWLKIKCVQRGKFPIVGFVKDPPASRPCTSASTRATSCVISAGSRPDSPARARLRFAGSSTRSRPQSRS